MTEVKSIQGFFGNLTSRLLEIKTNPYETKKPENYHRIIKEIDKGGLLSCDLEDVIHYLASYIGQLNKLVDELPSIIETVKFPSNPFLQIHSVEQNSFEILVNKRKKLFEVIDTELKFYVKELTELLKHAEDDNDVLGSDRFATAKFKINLKLTIPQIGSLFSTLLQAGIIDEKRKNEISLSKKDLASFISKNFTQTVETQKLYYKDIKESTIVKHFSEDNSAIDPVISKFLKKLAFEERKKK